MDANTSVDAVISYGKRPNEFDFTLSTKFNRTAFTRNGTPIRAPFCGRWIFPVEFLIDFKSQIKKKKLNLLLLYKSVFYITISSTFNVWKICKNFVSFFYFLLFLSSTFSKNKNWILTMVIRRFFGFNLYTSTRFNKT